MPSPRFPQSRVPPGTARDRNKRAVGRHCACAERGRARAPPYAPSLKRVSPRPLACLPFPPCSHLGASLVGAEAGAETPGRPPAGLVHDLPGVKIAPPGCGLRPSHGVSAPRSRLLEGEKGGEGEGQRGGKQRCCALARWGGFQTLEPGMQLSTPALGIGGCLTALAQKINRPE